MSQYKKLLSFAIIAASVLLAINFGFRSSLGLFLIPVSETLFGYVDVHGNPIVPGVVIVEAMAQTAGVVVSQNLSNSKDHSVLFMSINKAKFRKPVLPNYKIKFYVELINNVKNVYKFMGRAFHNDTLVAESEFSAMITSK